MTTEKLTLKQARATVGYIVGRCHVGETDEAVVAYVKSRITAAGWKKHGRILSKAAILEHKANLKQYLWVMGGCR